MRKFYEIPRGYGHSKRLRTTALRSPSFKVNLPTFLANEWTKEQYAEIFSSSCLFLRHLDNCYRFSVNSKGITKEVCEDLATNHNEADTRICLHASKIDAVCLNIIVPAVDTDIAVTLLFHVHQFKATLWVDVGINN